MGDGVLYVEIMPSTRGIGKAVEGDLNKQFKGAEKTGEGFFSKVGTWAKRGTLAIGGMVAGVAALAVGGGISRALNIEDAQAKLKGLGHDTKSVEAIMTDALASVKGTAFGLDAAATTAAAAVASGIQPGKELEGYLKLTADAATIAGVSMEEMGSIMNKVQAKGKAQMEDLNRLTERGIPIMQMLAAEYGVTAEEMSEMVSRGEVDSERFRAALEKNVGGAALESGNTTRGAFKNMLASLSRLGVVFLGDGLSWAKTFFNEMTVIFDGLEERIGPWVERIQSKLSGMFQLDGMGDGFLDWFDRTIETVASGPIPQLLAALAPILPVVAELAAVVGGALGEAFREVGEALTPVLPMLGEALADAVVELAPSLTDLLVALIPLIPSLVQLLEAVTPLALVILEQLVPAVSSLAELLAGALGSGDLYQQFMDGKIGADEFLTGINGLLGPFGTLMQKAVEVGTAIGHFANLVHLKFLLIKYQATEAFMSLVTSVSTAWQNITTAISNGVNTAVSFVASLPGRIMSAIGSLAGMLFGVGQNMMQGLISGIQSMISSAVSAVVDAASSVVSAAKSALGIKSPSRVFRDEVGKMVGLGLLEGIEDTSIRGRIDAAVGHMVTIPDGLAGAVLPQTITLVDEDGSILTKARVVASTEVDTFMEQQSAAMRAVEIGA